jgi:hypothetical protein
VSARPVGGELIRGSRFPRFPADTLQQDTRCIGTLPRRSSDAIGNIHQLPDGREGFSMLTSKFLIAQEFRGRLVQNDRQARI